MRLLKYIHTAEAIGKRVDELETTGRGVPPNGPIQPKDGRMQERREEKRRERDAETLYYCCTAVHEAC